MSRMRGAGTVLQMVIFIAIGILAGVAMVYVPALNSLLGELAEIRLSDVIGVLGTIYALITAFVLVNVWQEHDQNW